MAFNLRKLPNLSAKLQAYPYQLDAVNAVCDMPYAAIFHEQGLGKTKIAIDLALYWLETDTVDTVFVITKKSLVQNWVNEIKTHAYVTPRVLSGDRRSNGHALNAPVLLYVMNYEICVANEDLISLFLGTCRVGAILDESQKIKNPEAKITQSFFNLSGTFSRKIIMTGTPVANRPYDIWSQIKFLDSGAALGDDFGAFRAEFDLPNRRTSEKYNLALSGINKKISGFSLRETKETAGIELPEKIIVSYLVDMSPCQQKIYENYRDKLAHEINTETGTYVDSVDEILKRLLRLVQCASNPFLLDASYSELPAKFEKTKLLLKSEDFSGAKTIIWTGFIANAEWLAGNLPQYYPVVVHGRVAIEQRNSAIDQFKRNKNCRILIATPGAAKEGLTLTVANHAIFYDRGFSLDDYLQAQDRIHRISQKQDCYVHNIMAKNSIDEWVDRLLYAKYIAARITQGDIAHTAGSSLFEIDLSEMLAEVLNT